MENERLTSKAVKLSRWISTALELIEQLQIIDDEIFVNSKNPDEYDGDWIQTSYEDMRRERQRINERLVHYRVTINELINDVDLSDLSPRMQAQVKRFARLRYYRGLPITRKDSAATIERQMCASRSMLTALNRIALNRLAVLWDENEPPL